MDVLWSPWRYEYIKSGDGEKSAPAECVFCRIAREKDDDERNFVIYRGEHNFIVLNIYPYISGHLLIIPYSHIADLDFVNDATSNELMDLTKRCQTVMREVYNPHGFNVGINLGKAAGAGVAEHLHLHFMPRWFGDANFMSTVAETRVVPEDLRTTYDKLIGKF